MAKESVKKEIKTKSNKRSASSSARATESVKSQTETKTKTEKQVKTSVKKDVEKEVKKVSTAKKVAPSTTKSAKKVAKKAPSTVRTNAKKTSSNSRKKSTKKTNFLEYYDLPYRYNQTTVRILAQTPTTLFVYWDISDEDREALLEKHGDNLFYETKPVLIVHNITKNYSFEIEINDFANSWYIRTQEPDCDYVIELGRRAIENKEKYIYIDSSNNIISPNDHILFEKSDLGHVIFKNVKTGNITSKDFGSLRFINDIDKLYGNVYDVYSTLYKEETLDKLANPSSGEFIKSR